MYKHKTIKIMTIWKIDPTHSEIQFKIKHLMISTVTGNFGVFESTLETISDSDFNGSKVNFSAQIESISTGLEQRDTHLKSADFFNMETFPDLSFEAKNISVIDNEVVANGTMKIKDISVDVALKGELGGTMVDFYNQTKVGFELSGKINRKDFGLTWSGITEAGGVVVSDEVKLVLNVQFTKET